MEMKETIKVRASETIEHMLDKIDQVLDDAADADYLTDSDVETVMKAWKTIHLAKTACSVFGPA